MRATNYGGNIVLSCCPSGAVYDFSQTASTHKITGNTYLFFAQKSICDGGAETPLPLHTRLDRFGLSAPPNKYLLLLAGSSSLKMCELELSHNIIISVILEPVLRLAIKMNQLLLFALSVAICSSCEITSVTSVRSEESEGDTGQPFRKKARELYETESFELNQDPCDDMPVVVEQINDEPTYYPSAPTSPPSAKPSVSPTTMEPVREVITTTSSTTTTSTESHDWGNDGYSNIPETPSHGSSGSTYSTHSSKSGKSSSSKSSKSSKGSKSGSGSGWGSREVHPEGANSGGLNKVSGMVQYAKATNSAHRFAHCFASSVSVSVLMFAVQVLI